MSTCLEQVSKYTRVSKDGRVIICPHCSNKQSVFHFLWSALFCSNKDCDKVVLKQDWLVIEKTKDWMAAAKRAKALLNAP